MGAGCHSFPFGRRLGWGQAAGDERRCNKRQDTLKIHKRFVRRESQHNESLFAEELVPLGVIRNLHRMLRSVQFDNQFRREARKIGDVISQGMLAPELDPELLHSKARPQPTFRIGHFAAQRASVELSVGCGLVWHAVPPSLPSPGGGRRKGI